MAPSSNLQSWNLFRKKNQFKLKTPQICKARISFSKRINSSRNLRGDKICGPTKRQSLLCSWPSQPLSPHVYLSFVGLCGALLKILNSNTYTWSVCKRCVSLTWNTCKTCKTFRTCQMGRICKTCSQNTRRGLRPEYTLWFAPFERDPGEMRGFAENLLARTYGNILSSSSLDVWLMMIDEKACVTDRLTTS